jgi:hypothetical protein
MKQANQISPLSSSSQRVPMGFAPAANKVVPAAARPPTTRAAITHIIFDMDSLLPGLALGIGERGGRLGPTSWGGDNFFFASTPGAGPGPAYSFFFANSSRAAGLRRKETRDGRSTAETLREEPHRCPAPSFYRNRPAVCEPRGLRRRRFCLLHIECSWSYIALLQIAILLASCPGLLQLQSCCLHSHDATQQQRRSSNIRKCLLLNLLLANIDP